MNENIQTLITEMQNCRYKELKKFAETFSEEKYNIILKIINNNTLSISDWDLILSKYKTDEGIMQAIFSSSLSAETKDQVVEMYIDVKNIDENFDTDDYVMECLLSNHSEISDNTLQNLFQNQHSSLLFTITVNADNPDLIQQSLIERIAKLELMAINNEIVMPKDYKIDADIFEFIKNKGTFSYIMSNMPNDAAISEMVATKLINSPIPNELKEQVFNTHCVNILKLKQISPQNAHDVYQSVVETAFNDDTMSLTDKAIAEEAQSALKNMIRYSLLPDSLQLDLIYRLLSDDKNIDKNIKKDLVLRLCAYAKSTDILHYIYNNFDDRAIQERAVKNLNAHPIDIKAQAELYVKEIEDLLQHGQRYLISDHSLDMLSNFINKATLDEHQYSTILKTHDATLIEDLIYSPHTPKEIIKQSELVVNEQMENSPSVDWLNLQTSIEIRRQLEKRNLFSKDTMQKFADCFRKALFNFKIDKETKFSRTTLQYYKDNPELLKILPDIFVSAVETITNPFKNKSVDEFRLYVENLTQKQNGTIETKKLKSMTIEQLLLEKSEILRNFKRLLDGQVLQCYKEMELMAEPFAQIQNEIETREKQLAQNEIEDR